MVDCRIGGIILKKPEIILPINEPRMIRGLFIKHREALKEFPKELKAILRRGISTKVDGLWGINSAIVDFNYYKGYGLAMSVFFANYDEDALESPKTSLLTPLAYEEPDVRYVVDEIIQPLIQKFLGEEVFFKVSTE